jgi:hypothetical protein
MNLTDCGNDYLDMTRSSGGGGSSYQCNSTTSGSIAITAGQQFIINPDSTATFSNLQIWWSATP